MIDKFFDRTYVISLRSAVHRQAHIRRNFARAGIMRYHFFEAVKGADLDLLALKKARILADKPAGHGNIDLNPNEVGCAWSHIKIYESALALGFKRVLICEDDVKFRDDAGELFRQYFEEMPADWDIIHFLSTRPVGCDHPWDRLRKKVSDHVYQGYNEGAGSGCYAITRRGMKFLLRHAYPINKSADGLTSWPTGWWKQCRKYKGYVVDPQPCSSQPFRSEIGGRSEEVEKILYRRWKNQQKK